MYKYKPSVNPLLKKNREEKPVSNILEYGNFYASTTGKIHRGLGPSAWSCSASNRSIYGRIISDSDAMSTPADQFCRKCFPNGKPE